MYWFNPRRPGSGHGEDVAGLTHDLEDLALHPGGESQDELGRRRYLHSRKGHFLIPEWLISRTKTANSPSKGPAIVLSSHSFNSGSLTGESDPPVSRMNSGRAARYPI